MNTTEKTADIINEANKTKAARLEQARINYAKRKAEGRLKKNLKPKEEQKKRGPKARELEHQEPKQRGRKPIIINDVSEIPQYINKLIKQPEDTPEQTIIHNKYNELYKKECMTTREILLLFGISEPLFYHLYNIDNFNFNVNISSMSGSFDITIYYKFIDNTYKIKENKLLDIIVDKNYNKIKLKELLKEFYSVAEERQRTPKQPLTPREPETPENTH
jgi:hypothetical protein